MTFLSLWSWVKLLQRRSAVSRRRPRRHERARCMLRLETLEARTVPSTLTVTNILDTGVPGDGSLRGELAAAQSGDTINFDPSLAGQTITLSKGELTITQSVNIQGPGADQLTVSGNNASRVFDIRGSTTNVTISGLTIADGLVNTATTTGRAGAAALGGGILNTGAHVALSHVVLVDNQAIAPQGGFVQTNLVSDIPGLAQLTDPNLRDAWGTAHSADGSFSIADHRSRVSTLYSVTAAGVSKEPLTISIPVTTFGPAQQGPTGQVANDTNSFLVNGTPATFIYCDLNGTIDAWNSSLGTTAQIETPVGVHHYTGIDIGTNASGTFLYAADTSSRSRVDVFNSSFALVSLGANAFVDPLLPAGLSPFNVENINGDLYVAYAPTLRKDAIAATEGQGVVAVFDTSGNFIKQLISGSKLASPWGIVLAPSSFGQFGGDLLVGNFSFAAPEINAFDPVSGAYLGTLTDSSGHKLLGNAQGIWDLSFGTGGKGGDPNTLYFSTGLNNENDGLFGAIAPAPSIAEGGAVANVGGGTLTLSHDLIAGNQALGAVGGNAQGGGVFSQGGTLTVDHSAFRDNQAIGGDGTTRGDGGVGHGGAMCILAGTAAIQNTQIVHNAAEGGAGGIGGSSGNGEGGGIANENGAQLTVTDSILSDNAAIGGRRNKEGVPPEHNGAGNGGGIKNNGTGTVAVVNHTTLRGNRAIGGDGVAGAAGGRGRGGAITTGFGATLTVSDSMLADNQAVGGNGSAGGPSPNGGNGGAATAGAILNVSGALTVADSFFLGNQALGGAGGAGGSGGHGGAGGDAEAGGIGSAMPPFPPRVLPALDISGSTFRDNEAIGGDGAAGGNGGNSQGGAFWILNGTAAIADTNITGNEASGGAGGEGANGGNGQGGGIWVGGGVTVTVSASRITHNRAEGGDGGDGTDGLGVGGGVYNLGTFFLDAETVIRHNHASTSDDDVFGSLTLS